MQKRLLNEVFCELKALGLVRSENDFSTNWLGKSESYARTLRFHKKPASIGAVAVCGIKLQRLAGTFGTTNAPAAERIHQLSEQCFAFVLAEERNDVALLNAHTASMDTAQSCQHDT